MNPNPAENPPSAPPVPQSLRQHADALAGALAKYQTRYHGAAQAQKDWEASQQILASYRRDYPSPPAPTTQQVVERLTI